MSELQSVSRADLYEDESSSGGSSPIYLPNIDFEIIDYNQNVDSANIDKVEVQSDHENPKEEFDFPLFAPSASAAGTEEGERGRSITSIMKVTLREPSPITIKNERPSHYYFAEYSDSQKKGFILAAITGDEIIKESTLTNPDSYAWKIIDLESFNRKIEMDNQKKKKRPGKKKREAIIACNARKRERSKIKKIEETAEQAKIQKKIFHKRGGKKHKKSSSNKTTNSKPKPKPKPTFRTE